MLTVASEGEGTKKLHQYCGKKIAFRRSKEKKISPLEIRKRIKKPEKIQRNWQSIKYFLNFLILYLFA